MKAMIFAAGLGTRLRPLTDHKPKALMTVGGKTALQRVIERLRDTGIGSMVVNVHHLPHEIRRELSANGNFGVDIQISDESERLLDTGGGLCKALPLLGGDAPVLLHNADIVTDFPVCEMVRSHVDGKADVTLLVADRTSSRKLLMDSDGRMQGWTNLNIGEVRPAGLDPKGLTEMAFGGVHIVGPKAFSMLEDYRRIHGDAFSITQFYIAACRDLVIKGFTPRQPFRWFDIGRQETLRLADESFSGQ